MTLHNLLLHLARRYIKICVLIRHTFCESLVKIYGQLKSRDPYGTYIAHLRTLLLT